MDSKTLTDCFTAAGLDTEEKLMAFLKPAAISAAMSDIDGKIESYRQETSAIEVERQARLAELTAKREELRAKLSE